jgi:hypothetical protein
VLEREGERRRIMDNKKKATHMTQKQNEREKS